MARNVCDIDTVPAIGQGDNIECISAHIHARPVGNPHLETMRKVRHLREQGALDGARELKIARNALVPDRKLVAALLQRKGVADSQDQLAGIERFADVVHRPQLKTHFDVFDSRFCRDHDHRNTGRSGFVAKATAQLKAIHVGHHHVDENEIERFLQRNRQRGRPGIGIEHLASACLQQLAQIQAIRQFIVDHQHATGQILIQPRGWNIRIRYLFVDRHRCS